MPSRYEWNEETDSYERKEPAKLVPLRIPPKIIETLKAEAGHNLVKIGYQTLAVNILRAWCEEKAGPQKYCPKPKKKQKKTRR